MIIERLKPNPHKNKHKKKKKPAPPKQVKGYRYSCINGHKRIEREKLEVKPLPICTSCHMGNGQINRLVYRGECTLQRL